jgi:hypothetical protein
MWDRTRVKAVVLRNWAPPCGPACCAAVAAAGNCRWSIAAPVDACPDMFALVIEETVDPAGV